MSKKKLATAIGISAAVLSLGVLMYSAGKKFGDFLMEREVNDENYVTAANYEKDYGYDYELSQIIASAKKDGVLSVIEFNRISGRVNQIEKEKARKAWSK